jgi:8-oxo-dGTP diphosphatase
VTHSSWRTATLEALTRAAYEVFRRSPSGPRRLLIRLITPNYTLGTVAVCEDADGRVLLVRSRQHAGWGLPGGLVQRGETPSDGLAREIAEELSIVVPSDRLSASPQHTVIDSATQHVTVVFAVALEGRPTVDGDEVLEARWFAEADLPRSLVHGTWESLKALGVVSSRALP